MMEKGSLRVFQAAKTRKQNMNFKSFAGEFDHNPHFSHSAQTNNNNRINRPDNQKNKNNDESDIENERIIQIRVWDDDPSELENSASTKYAKCHSVSVAEWLERRCGRKESKTFFSSVAELKRGFGQKKQSKTNGSAT